ncbi:hypothetical protein LTS13_001309 [Exophiala xenobiotica]|nr:hypothetical protein LTR40_002996 [Exophiala xenobiotica]KAK5536124.1 hypothetical protein LTR23_008145 [Chaetothyriales sp. CCFEE 6169]KAK5388373.1 hypothetical protein LTS13_001309 [Exophiala xenobiotica]KAK5398462.1 hypothetical protein LTR79_004744 [Exophiala xenobiotica]KAK5433591.1 hypothetical protein LTR18_010541 [Exophiala xenobiotica]
MDSIMSFEEMEKQWTRAEELESSNDANHGLSQPLPFNDFDLVLQSVEEEFPQAGGHSESNNTTSDDDALPPTTSGTADSNAEVAPSLDSAEQYLQELNVLMDRMDAARAIVEQHFSRLKDEITELKKANPDIRQRGLRGGQARKQMATGVPFVSITKLAPAERQRRTNVEAQDYKARTRRTGLEKMKAMFKSCYKLIEKQQTLAKQAVEHDAALVGINRDEVVEMEEMLTTFETEFRCD